MCHSHYLFPLQLNGHEVTGNIYTDHLKLKKKLPEKGFQMKKCGFIRAALWVCEFSARTLDEVINQFYVSVNIQFSRVCVSALDNETLMSQTSEATSGRKRSLSYTVHR